MDEMGLKVTGVDAAEKMLEIAKRRDAGGRIHYMIGDVLEGLPFADHSFDVVITSYVAHGLQEEERKTLYREMGRLAKTMVIVYDYNKNRAPLTNFIEWLEGGDYFRFIHVAEEELRGCVHALETCFQHVQVLDVDKRAAWYLCQVPDPLAGT
jgi:ubiquinone/menaquinone biosynthesis C-methylase UbiE